MTDPSLFINMHGYDVAVSSGGGGPRPPTSVWYGNLLLGVQKLGEPVFL